MKCNRASPCEACVKSGDRATCSYESKGSRGFQKGNQHAPQQDVNRDVLTARIDRLEALLLSAAGNGSRGTGQDSVLPLPSGVISQDASGQNGDFGRREVDGVDELTKEFGFMKVNESRTLYVGGSHWVSVMSEVSSKSIVYMCHSSTAGSRYKNSEITSLSTRKSWNGNRMNMKHFR